MTGGKTFSRAIQRAAMMAMILVVATMATVQLASAQEAPPESVVIGGMVYDSSGNPLSGATVTLTYLDVTRTTTSDE